METLLGFVKRSHYMPWKAVFLRPGLTPSLKKTHCHPEVGAGVAQFEV
jgi:hypothetical protein